jgi:curved DNA-binding protein
MTVPTPDGNVQLNVPKGSTSGRKLRLKAKGLPGNPAGDLYVVLVLHTPPADSAAAEQAYAAMAGAFPQFNPRSALEA